MCVLADCFQTVQVEFEARNPEDQDFHGIRKLLQQVGPSTELNETHSPCFKIYKLLIDRVPKIINPLEY